MKNTNTFIGYSQTTDDVCDNLKDYNATKKRRVLIEFDDMIVNIKSNKKLRPIVSELFLRRRKLNIFLIFTSQFYFKVTNTLRLNATHYFIMKIPNKREIQQIASNHSPDIDIKDFTKLYKDYTKEQYLFLVNDTNLLSDNPLRFRKNLL